MHFSSLLAIYNVAVFSVTFYSVAFYSALMAFYSVALFSVAFFSVAFYSYNLSNLIHRDLGCGRNGGLELGKAWGKGKGYG